MSARESIENLWDRATPVAPLLDAYAHELAEKIRKQQHETHDHISCLPCFVYGDAADSIDPEVLNGE